MRLPRVRLTIGWLVLAIAVLTVVAGGLIAEFRAARSRLVVVKRSGQPIVRLEVSTRSVPVATFLEVPDGAEQSATFRVAGDNSLDLGGCWRTGPR